MACPTKNDRSANGKEKIDRAFNMGSDARIFGDSLQDNPFVETDEFLFKAWRRGWLDVHSHYGKDAKWPVAPIGEA